MKTLGFIIDRNTTTCFDYFGIEYILREVLRETKYKSIKYQIIKKQYYYSVTRTFYQMAFTKYMIAGKTLSNNYTNLVFSNDYQKNDKIIYNHFKDKYVKRKHNPWLQT